MNTLRNKVQLIGNLGNDPEIINLESGKTLAKFAIATNESYTNNKGEKITDTQWHNVVAWGKVAELSEKLLRKGAEIVLEGKLVHDEYETKEGEKRTVFEVEVDEVGPSLRNATAKVTKTQRAGGTSGGFSAPAAADSFTEDPWAAASSTPSGGGWGASSTTDDPPF